MKTAKILQWLGLAALLFGFFQALQLGLEAIDLIIFSLSGLLFLLVGTSIEKKHLHYSPVPEEELKPSILEILISGLMGVLFFSSVRDFFKKKALGEEGGKANSIEAVKHSEKQFEQNQENFVSSTNSNPVTPISQLG